MMKKIFLFISIFFIYNCGYSSLYLEGKRDIFINLKEITGDFELNNYIRNDIKISSDRNSSNIFDLSAKTKYEKIILTKDATGLATDYRLDLSVKFTILSENNKVILIYPIPEVGWMVPQKLLNSLPKNVNSKTANTVMVRIIKEDVLCEKLFGKDIFILLDFNLTFTS